MQARCYPFNMPKHWYHNMNIQVYCTWFIPCLSHIYPWFIPFLPVQDNVLTVPPYSFVLEGPVDVPVEDCWVASPSFFTCHLRPTDRPGTGGRQKPVTLTARTTSESRWYSTAPSKNWTCPVLVKWKSSTWAKFLMCWVACPCFSTAALHQPSHTSSISISAADFHTTAREARPGTQESVRRGCKVYDVNPWAMAVAVWARQASSGGSVSD